ncbi:MAG: NAD(P)H-binding protein [Acidobacteria bacterium]|nr:NAD(P)H-binding protein [Acidobacteriota bacterium]
MKLLVLGATGGTGMEIVRQAIDGGHAVTALVRNRAPLKVFQDRVAIRQGNLLSSAELERAIAGHDAILSGFGPRVPVSSADANLMREFAAALTTAMTAAGVKRVVVVSVAFLFKDSIVPPAYILGRMFFPNVVADAGAMESVFANSELDWTIVRPPRLTDKPRTSKYRIREGHLPGLGFTISRADVADFVLGSVENRSTVHKVFGVSN